MGYRIEYDSRAGKYEVRDHDPLRLPLVLSCLVCLVLFLTFAFWEAGADYLREVLLPGDNEATAGALRLLTQRLRQGEGLREAVTAFCMDVVHGSASGN